MARKLPWENAGSSGSKASRLLHTPPRIRRQIPDERQQDERTNVAQVEMAVNTPKKKRSSSRTPSTSPPPGPPEVEPMESGYDADDIYMMVEDEFQTVAQSFTAHLHHAEYKRLVRLAREAPHKELPDPISPMAKEGKRNLQRGILESKQKGALAQVIHRKGNTSDDSEDDKVDNPWIGTRLAGLVDASSKPKTSLIGLERMSSSTRAARGFSRSESDDQKKIRSIFSQAPQIDERARVTRGPTSSRQTENGQLYSSSKRLSPRDDHESSGQSPVKKKIKQEDLTPKKTLSSVHRDEIHVSTNLPKPSAPSSRSNINVLSAKRKPAKKEDIEDRLDTVPLFIL